MEPEGALGSASYDPDSLEVNIKEKDKGVKDEEEKTIEIDVNFKAAN